MRLFDTARVYSDSEEKVGIAFEGMRDMVYITTKTQAKNPEDFRKDLDTSLRMLRTDYIDVYQLHCAPRCFAPGDGSGLYECMLEAKKQGKIRHIGITAHLIQVAMDAAGSGLYETIQFPFRGCGYCMPCPSGIIINNCARMSLMLRRAPSKDWLTEYWQKEMKKIENCIGCRSTVQMSLQSRYTESSEEEL